VLVGSARKCLVLSVCTLREENDIMQQYYCGYTKTAIVLAISSSELYLVNDSVCTNTEIEDSLRCKG